MINRTTLAALAGVTFAGWIVGFAIGEDKDIFWIVDDIMWVALLLCTLALVVSTIAVLVRGRRS